MDTQCETRGQLLDNPNVEGQLHEGGARRVCVWESSEYQQRAWGCGPQRLILKKVPESGGAWGCWSQLLGSLSVPDQLLEGSSQKLGRHWDMLREELLLLCKTMFLQAKHNVNKVRSEISLLKNTSRKQTEVVISKCLWSSTPLRNRAAASPSRDYRNRDGSNSMFMIE